MIEVGLSTVVPAVAVISAVLSLVLIAIMGICGSSEVKTAPEVDMSGYGTTNNTLAPAHPASPPGTLPVGGRDQMPSYKLFKDQGADGVVNEREAPETFNQRGSEFDMKSVNYSNFTDFRGDNVEKATEIQDKVAKDTNGVSGMFTQMPDADSEYDSEYDSESDDNAPKKNYGDDLDANITYQQPGAIQQRGQGNNPGGVIQSLAFTPEEVQQRMAEVNESHKSRRRVKKSVRIKKKKGPEEIERKRKKVKRRRKKKREEAPREAESDEVDESIMNPTNV